MDYQEGDPVIHWIHGLGKVVGLEKRAIAGKNTVYYAVQVNDLTVWVPDDADLEKRLRPPLTRSDFEKILALLSAPAQPLPDNRQERKLLLMEWLRDGQAESLCRVIRDLTAYHLSHTLNDSDHAILKRAQNALIGEWGLVLSITTGQAEHDLQEILTSAIIKE
jgi:RNA polymerase-interacting CarD/CdnL/TRCF family regulator